MIYVGIGIAKLNHFAVAISSDWKKLIEPFTFTNDYDGFYLLHSKLFSLKHGNSIICLVNRRNITVTTLFVSFFPR